jgi:predicted HicB family RNase H-like nuclease
MSIKKLQMPVRFRPSTKEDLEKAAYASEMSQSEYVAKAVEEKLERERKEGRL